MIKNEIYLLGKAMALIEDLYLALKDPTQKIDYSHKIKLLEQDIEKVINQEIDSLSAQVAQNPADSIHRRLIIEKGLVKGLGDPIDPMKYDPTPGWRG